MTKTQFDCDLLVIGGGSGGVRAARMAAQRGARVILVEGARMGGTCVNVGCIPKKLYSHAAEYAEAFEESKGYGWQLGTVPSLHWDALKAARAQEILRLNTVYERLLESANVKVVRGYGRFVDAHTVEVNSAHGTFSQHSAANILIASGGTPFVPAIPGAELTITSNEIFDLPTLPQRLVVVGGGYIGCEMASIFHGLGVAVTQIYRGTQILRSFDDEVRHFVATELVHAGIDLRVNCEVQRILAHPDGSRHLTLSDGRTLLADTVLYATGRQPNVDNLNLEAVSIQRTEHGSIQVDDHFATNVGHIYALGDVVGRLELTPVALAEAMALTDHLFGPMPGHSPRTMDYNHIPTAVFTHPPIGTVGLTETQALQQLGAIRVYRSDFKPLKHTLSGSRQRTLVKLIVDDASDRVVGLHMVGSNAGEIVQGFAVALKCGATKAQFDATIGVHPTSAEEFVTLCEVTRTVVQ